MSWLTNFVLPKIRAAVGRKAVPDNLWHKCPGCEQMLFYRELEANLHVCRNCGHHLRIGAERRLKILFDDGAFTRDRAAADGGRSAKIPRPQALHRPAEGGAGGVRRRQ